MSDDLWKQINAAPRQPKGPPEHVSAGELWAKLNEHPRPTRVVDFPRRDAEGKAIGQVAIWVLTQEEQMVCAATAERFAKERVKDGKPEDLGYETVYVNQAIVEVLYRVCRRVDDVKMPAFPSPGLIREKLTAEECQQLFESYLDVERAFSSTPAAAE